MENAYDYVYRHVREKIVSGEYPEKSLLPPEPVLCKTYGVSRTTVRRAIEMLTHQGYIQPRRGIGTVVLRARASQDLNRLSSLTSTLEKQGFTVSHKRAAITVQKADAEAAEKLGIAEGEDVACIERVVCASGQPMAILYNVIPYAYVPDIEEEAGCFLSLYRLLHLKYHLKIEMTQDKITASGANAAEAADLAVPEGFALIRVDRLCMSGGRVVSWDRVGARGDCYSFEASLFSNS